MASSSSHQHPKEDNPEELDEVLILENNNTTNVHLVRRTLVGKLVTNKQFNGAVVKDLVAKAWSNYDNLQISELGQNKFLFIFDKEEHSWEVFKRSPWFILNHLLCLQFWILEASPHELYFDENPFWIQVHNLPLEYLNKSNVTTILSKVGRVDEVEEPIE